MKPAPEVLLSMGSSPVHQTAIGRSVPCQCVVGTRTRSPSSIGRKSHEALGLIYESFIQNTEPSNNLPKLPKAPQRNRDKETDRTEQHKNAPAKHTGTHQQQHMNSDLEVDAAEALVSTRI